MPSTTINRLRTSVRGHKLLKDKRDELMKQFMDVVRENRALRKRVEEGLMRAHGAFTVAAALMSPEMLEQSLLYPKQSVELDMKTRRRVNALEYVKIPEMQANIKYITMKLDENERANTIRLMKVKDMILKEAIEEKRAETAHAVETFGGEAPQSV